MPSYIFTARSIKGNTFSNEPGDLGKTQYLRVPDDLSIQTAHIVPRATWISEIQQAAVSQPIVRPDIGGEMGGNTLIYIHGYNNSQEVMLARHRQLETDLKHCGWRGVVVSYDWPSASSSLTYLEDRDDAKITAFALVRDGIRVLAASQQADCRVAVHLLAHSMGAYLVREAFDHADDNAPLRGQVWGVGQCVFIGGDVSSGSLGESDSSVSIYKHCHRFTNYSNGADAVLQISNAKRFGAAPRAGRVGLPADAPDSAVNVDCTEYWNRLDEAQRRLPIGSFTHSWYFGDLGFTADLAATLDGGLDRAAIPTRAPLRANRFTLSV